MVTYELKIPHNETQVTICSKHGSSTAGFLKSNSFTPAREVRRCPLLFLIRYNRKMVELHPTLLNVESEHLPPRL
jgi:hypothetical protein